MKKVLLATPKLAVAVCRYGPGERHARHTDRHSRISFLLRGGYREEGRSGATCMAPGDVMLKSHRALHEDEFGPDGATLIALEFLQDDPFDIESPCLWRRRSDGFALRHATAYFDAALTGDSEAAATAGVDLLCATQEAAEPRAAAPVWLDRLRRELEERSLASVSVAAHAHRAGAHPAHVSRLFRSCYGASITEHAQTQSVRRALAALASTRPGSLSDIALAAGFFDQSHMTRIFRRVTGRTPGRHRAMLAAAAS